MGNPAKKRIVSFRIEHRAIEIIDSKSKNRSLVMRDAINNLIHEGITKDDIIAVALSIPVDEKTRTSVKINEEMLDGLKRIAEQNQIHMSELIRIAIWKHLLKDGAVSVPQ